MFFVLASVSDRTVVEGNLRERSKDRLTSPTPNILNGIPVFWKTEVAVEENGTVSWPTSSWTDYPGSNEPARLALKEGLFRTVSASGISKEEIVFWMVTTARTDNKVSGRRTGKNRQVFKRTGTSVLSGPAVPILFDYSTSVWVVVYTTVSVPQVLLIVLSTWGTWNSSLNSFLSGEEVISRITVVVKHPWA